MLELPPLYEDLVFLSPLSEQRAEGLVACLAEGRPGTVLDIGCGWGEFLLRAAEASPGSRGLGVDLEPQRLEEARRRAASRGLGDRVRFEARDGREVSGSFDAVVCIGASHVWGLPVEAAQPLDYAAALTALRALVRPGGRLIYGEAVWSTAPTPAATAALSGRDDEYLRVDELAELASTHGFTVESALEASQEEWDAFEAGFVRRLERWLEACPGDDPDAEGVRTQLGEQRERYLNGYRGVLGLAYLTLVAG